MANKQAPKNKRPTPKKPKLLTQQPAFWIGLFALAAIVLVIVLSTGKAIDPANLPSEISAADAYKLYSDKAAVFIDVREQFEWDSFHIPGATLIPLGELPDRLNEVPKDRPVVIVCNSGNRSISGRGILKQAGYTNVASMNGGMLNWRASKYPIEP